MDSDGGIADSGEDVEHNYIDSSDDFESSLVLIEKKRKKGCANGAEPSKRLRNAATPKTPQRGHAQQRRPRAGALKKPRKEVVIVDSDSSDSEYVLPSKKSEDDDDDDDDDSDSDFHWRKRAWVAKKRRAAKVPASRDDDDGSPVARGRSNSANSGRGGRSSRPVNRQRSLKSPKVELRWERLQREWEEVWAQRDWGEDAAEAVDTGVTSVHFGKRNLEEMEPASELITPLLPFQKEWLAWSLKQEASDVKGGILADEMGMGKTIQAIALILSGRALNRSPLPDIKSSGYGPQCNGRAQVSPPQLPRVRATLVICPLVAVIQWRNEVARFTREGSVRVFVYHGPKRGQAMADLSKYDIVLTTYSVVEVEHRKHVMPPKDKCQWCSRQFYPEKMAIHLRYFCGPHARKTDKQAKQVKRKSEPGKTVADNGGDDSSDSSQKLKGKLKGKGRGEIASGNRKSRDTSSGQARERKRKISEADLNGALEGAIDKTQAAAGAKSTGNSVLHAVRWERVVLDEAHSIKDRRCSTAKAVFALQSDYKWALSGTPLQNRVGELYSLVRFLGMDPFSYYFCRKCDCSSLEYKFAAHGQKCDCGHTQMVHFCWWNKYIAAPIKKDGYGFEGCRSMTLLKQRVLGSCLLRRTKLERAADLALPPRTALLRRDAFDEREDDFYQALYTQSQSQFNTYVTAGTLVNNYAHIFDLLTRLRQAVDHPYLVVYTATGPREQVQYEGNARSETQCGLCADVMTDPVVTACCHSYCRSCLSECLSRNEDPVKLCPGCSKTLTVDFTEKLTTAKTAAKENGYKRKSILSRMNLDQFQTSTKIEAVVLELFTKISLQLNVLSLDVSKLNTYAENVWISKFVRDETDIELRARQKEELCQMLEEDATAKALIFSQFTSMLELIGFSLSKAGIKFVKLDGSMSMSARDHMIETFTNDVDTKVFLMSLKAGGVALNLTVASHVFLMDPWWNPAVEQQAQDRIHRLGQFKPIRVIRFIIENTIEERILKLQEKKQLVFEGTVGGSSEALGKLTEEDLRFLFTN